MGSSLVISHRFFIGPLVEDLALLDLSLPLPATSVLGAVLVAVLALVVAGAVPNLTPVAGQGGNICCLYGVA